LTAIPFASAPLKIITNEREFVDDAMLNTAEMVAFFDGYKGKSKTSSPGPNDWLEAFGDADDVFCITITSGLSGSYNAACAAKDLYEARDLFVRYSKSFIPDPKRHEAYEKYYQKYKKLYQTLKELC
jgi:fatty acid-binding protein DegV